MNFLELAESVIEKVNQPLTGNEIWEKAKELGFDKMLNRQGKTPWATLGARLYVDVRDNPKSKFEAHGKGPVRFGLKGMSVSNRDISGSEKEKVVKYSERDIHPLVVKFVDSNRHFRGAKLKTIFHEKSLRKKKGYNEWLHPDLVGVYFSFNDSINKYERVLIEFQNDFSIPAAKLFSFEVKIKIEVSTLREYYFQAVSNSSWANEGYLVAIHFDDEVIEEARRLANSFGIGLIKLHPANIEDSEIIIPATYRKELDIDTMDRLVSENSDFADFIQNIIDDKKITKVNSTYDKVFNDTEFSKYVKDKGIL